MSAENIPNTALMPMSALDTSKQMLESEKPIDAGDVEAMYEINNELRDINEVQRGLEIGIMASGFQVMADRFGAEQLLDAMKTEPSFHEVVNKLAPNKEEQKELLDAIKAEPISELATRMNEKVGGVSDGTGTVEQMELYRQFSVSAIEEGKAIDGGDMLYAGNLDKLLQEHPELTEDFIQTNDTLTLLKGIRDIYGQKDAEFAPKLEEVKEKVKAKVEEGEMVITELQELSDSIHTDEIQALQARLESASSKGAIEMINALLDKKAAEVAESRAELLTRKENAKTRVLTKLGAARLDDLIAPGPVMTMPIRTDKYTSMPVRQD
jgi:hypothetical protein